MSDAAGNEPVIALPTRLGGYWAKAPDGSVVVIHAIKTLDGKIIFISGNYEIDPSPYRDWRKVDTGLLDSRRARPPDRRP
jgi:hypothetical protein